MTALPASIGLLPAALSHSIGSDTQRPFAIVIVGGLLPATLLTMFLLPTTYQLAERWFGRWRATHPEVRRSHEGLTSAAVGLACALLGMLGGSGSPGGRAGARASRRR